MVILVLLFFYSKKNILIIIKMADVSSMNSIALGNSRRQEVRNMNERIQQHNNDVANQISQIKDQVATANVIQQAKDTAQGLWTGASMPDKIKAYKDWKASRTASNPTTQSDQTTSQTATENAPENDATTPAQNSTDPPTEPVAEGSPTGAGLSDEAESVGSKLTSGVPKGALTEAGESAFEKIGKGAGVLGSAARGGLDLYNDIKNGTPAGNNDWQRAGNLVQIGGSVADIVGTAYPPAKLLGGVLDLTAGALDEIGGATDDTSEKKEADIQKTETESAVAVPETATTTGGGVS